MARPVNKAVSFVVREKIKGSGVFHLFYSYQGQRKHRKVGTEEQALEAKDELEAKLTLKQLQPETLFLAPKKAAAKVTVKPAVTTFEFYCNLWMEKFMNPTSKSDYECIQKNHLQGSDFYREPIENITALDVRSFLADKRKDFASSTCQHIKNLMSHAFETARMDQKIDSNPCLGKRMIPEHGKEKKQLEKPFNEAEVQALLTAFRTTRYYVFVLFLARSGCRIGEVCGLQWKYIDLDKRKATICRSYSKGTLGDTKTGKSRDIDLTQGLVKELRLLKLQTQSKSKFVFQNASGGPVDSNNFRQRHWGRILKAAGLRHTRIHDLRHSFASLLVKKTKDIFYVSKQCGHSDIKITYKVYGHLLEDDSKTRLVDVLDEACEA